jgi:glycerol-3-phosphate dehydrogenase
MTDVLVVGGGISGLGVARAAARAGYTVTLLEGREVAGATSNNTLRIIHGGFRYLQTFDLPRMVKSIRDQRDLFAQVPQALSLLPCVMPLNRFGLKSRLPVTVASLLYGATLSALRSPVDWPRVVGGASIETKVEILRGRVRHGVLEWSDLLMVNPRAIAQALLRECEDLGVVVHAGTPAHELERVGDVWRVKTEQGVVLSARGVVSTLGPWAQNLQGPSDLPPLKVQWCKGFNLVVKKQLEPVYGVGLESSEGRLFFIVPRGEHSAIGTWYLPFSGDPDHLYVSNEEIVTFISAFNAAFGRPVVAASDVVHVDVGVLPARGVGARGPELLGNELLQDCNGYVRVISTKYTTFRSQADRVVRVLQRYVTPSG